MSGNANSSRWHGYMRKRRVEDGDQLHWRGLVPQQVKVGRLPYVGLVNEALRYELLWAEDSPSLMLTYKLRDRAGRVEQVCIRVVLQADRPPGGGVRWWLVCPNTYCRRRCASLYRPADERYYCCRQCHDLTYRSAQTANEATFVRRTRAWLQSV